MTWIIDEQISALLDGELPAEQESLLLSRLEREPEIRAKLARYGFIGELLRDNAAQAGALSVSDRVSAAIAAGDIHEASSDGLVSGPERSSSTGAGLTGAAIAASIALAVVLNLSEIENATHQPGIESAARSTHEHSDVMAVDPARLTRYLVSHSRYSNSASRQLFDSHIAMAVNTELVASLDSYE